MANETAGEGKNLAKPSPPPPSLSPEDKELFLKQYGKQRDWTDEEIEMALLLGYR